MTYFKRRLSIFLCMLLAFSAMFMAMPQETKAAGNVIFGGMASDDEVVQVYKGSKSLYAGDMVMAWDGTTYKNYGYLSMNSGVTYKSSKPSVASVNSKTGKITAKKNGTTVITVRFKGATQKINLEVLSKKTIMNDMYGYQKEMLPDLEDAAKVLLSAVGSTNKITTANRYKILTACASYDYQNESGYNYDYNDGKSYNSVYCPQALHAEAVCKAMKLYVNGRNPFGTDAAKAFVIKNISAVGNSQKINVTLKKNVTEEQIFAGQGNLTWNTEIKKTNTYSFPIMVQNMKTRCKYYAVATVQKGSNKMTIETRDLKLKKGTKYRLVAKEGFWLDGTINNPKFTAK